MSALSDRLCSKLHHRWQRPAGYREVLLLAGPLVLSTSTSTVQQFVNRMFLSWYSPETLAASLPGGALSFTFLCFFIGAASYANTFVAQYYGSGQPGRIAASVWQAVYLSLLSALLIVPAGLLAGPLFALAGHPVAVRALEVIYFQILVYGGVFCILSSALSAFFTGLGRTRTVMWVNVCVAALNGLLDYGLIFGHWHLPPMGIAGAAWATIISQAIGAGVFFAMFVCGSEARTYEVWRNRAFDRELFARLWRYGAPSGLHFMLDLLAWSLFILMIGRLGMVPLGASNLAFQINNVVFLPMIGFSIATSTLVGQRLGQGRADLAARTTWSAFQMTFTYMATIAALYFALPHLFLMPFGAHADPKQFATVAAAAAIMLRFVALYSLFDGVNLIFSAALKGAGDTLFVMLGSSTLGMTLMVLPTWLICRDGTGSIWAAWTALTAFICVLAGLFMWRFLQGRWRTMRVTEVPPPAPPVLYPTADVPMVEAE